MPTYNIPTATVRVVLRAFFLLFIATAGFVADHLLAKLSKIRVFRRENIPLPDALGTAGGLDCSPLRSSYAPFQGAASALP